MKSSVAAAWARLACISADWIRATDQIGRPTKLHELGNDEWEAELEGRRVLLRGNESPELWEAELDGEVHSGPQAVNFVIQAILKPT